MKIITLLVILLLAVPAFAQNVTLAWDLSVDDAKLGPGGGYHIYQSKQSGTYGTTPKASVAAGITTVTFSAVELGKLYWVATAFMADGTESAYSNEVNTTIKPKPPKLNTVQQVASLVKEGIVRMAGIFKKDSGLRVVN